jgi:transcriptional regulator with XRE-family HTH domain
MPNTVSPDKIAKNGMVASAIRQYIKSHRMTQQQFADPLGMSGASVTLWSRGIGVPKPETRAKIREHYGIDIDVLLQGPPGKELMLIPRGNAAIATASRPEKGQGEPILDYKLMADGQAHLIVDAVLPPDRALSIIALLQPLLRMR